MPRRGVKGRAIQWHAVCDCGAEWDSPNAQGLASQHAARYRHVVSVEVLIVYDGEGSGQNPPPEQLPRPVPRRKL